MKESLELIAAILSSGHSSQSSQSAYVVMKDEQHIPPLPAAIMAINGLDYGCIIRYKGFLVKGYDTVQSAFMALQGSPDLPIIDILPNPKGWGFQLIDLA